MGGCGPTWGDLDILQVPKLPGVMTYQFPYTASGCPRKGKFVFTKKINVAQDSVVYVTGHIISKSTSGRADLYLDVDGKRKDHGLTVDVKGQWNDASVHWAGIAK